MVDIKRIEQNLMAYIVEDLVPKMPKLEGVIFATGAPFVVRAKLPRYISMVQGTELANEESVNVDLLYQQLKENCRGKWPFEMAGFKFYEDDLDKLYRYIVR